MISEVMFQGHTFLGVPPIRIGAMPSEPSLQKKLGRVRPPRVQITYDVETGDSLIKKELPFVMGVLADLSGDLDPDAVRPPLDEREFIDIDRDSFNRVMAGIAPRLQLSVPNRLKRGEGLDLRLMSSLKDVGEIPTEGKNLVIVAALDQALYFRIFDSDGKEVMNTDEKKLTGQARQIEDLKRQLKSLWPPYKLTTSDHRPIVASVLSIVYKLGLVVEFKSIDDFDPENLVLNIKELRELFEARRRLDELRTKIAGNSNLKDLIQKVVETTDKLRKPGAEVAKS